MKAFVDIDRCIGCEFCASTCPQIFQIKEISPDVEKSFPSKNEIPDDILDLAYDVEDRCPVAAIIIE